MKKKYLIFAVGGGVVKNLEPTTRDEYMFLCYSPNPVVSSINHT